MIDETSWPAKLLLFGEYSILLGSAAVSVPCHLFSASLQFMKDDIGNAPEETESNRQLKKLDHYFRENQDTFREFLDLERFSRDVLKGLYLSSTIPQRYGMGSSGALCAAVYSQYADEPIRAIPGPGSTDLPELRSRFVSMESFFHGKSSGFDPLVIYLKKPLRLGLHDEVIPVGFYHPYGFAGQEILLVDSRLPCSTGSRVPEFLEKYFPDGKITEKGEKMISLANSCIDLCFGMDDVNFRHALGWLSKFQLDEMGHLIPEHLQPVWTEGLETGLFSMKLCGSGGGGFLLCFTADKPKTSDYFKNKGIPVVSLQL